MAYFAELNISHQVVRVLAVDNQDTQDKDGNEVEEIGVKYLHDAFGGDWKRTSYNTHGGVHKLDETPFRKNYAGINYTYDEARDAFIPLKPFSSWVLNEDTCLWEAPVPYPDGAQVYEYVWNEESISWIRDN